MTRSASTSELDQTAIVQGLINLVGISRTLQLASNPSAVPPLPHTLLHEALLSKDEVDRKVIDAQCNTLVETLNSSGALDNSLAVCDVSGSMGSIHRRMNGNHVSAILPAIALSIVLAQIARPPWNNAFITFSANPKVERIDPADGLVSSWFTLTGV
jgi:Domain of unknown function (DUF2828)